MVTNPRARNTTVTTVQLHNEARAFLDSLVAGRQGHGQVLSQLLLQEKARREERQRITEELIQKR